MIAIIALSSLHFSVSEETVSRGFISQRYREVSKPVSRTFGKWKNAFFRDVADLDVALGFFFFADCFSSEMGDYCM